MNLAPLVLMLNRLVGSRTGLGTDPTIDPMASFVFPPTTPINLPGFSGFSGLPMGLILPSLGLAGLKMLGKGSDELDLLGLDLKTNSNSKTKKKNRG